MCSVKRPADVECPVYRQLKRSKWPQTGCKSGSYNYFSNQYPTLLVLVFVLYRETAGKMKTASFLPNTPKSKIRWEIPPCISPGKNTDCKIWRTDLRVCVERLIFHYAFNVCKAFRNCDEHDKNAGIKRSKALAYCCGELYAPCLGHKHSYTHLPVGAAFCLCWRCTSVCLVGHPVLQLQESVAFGWFFFSTSVETDTIF